MHSSLYFQYSFKMYMCYALLLKPFLWCNFIFWIQESKDKIKAESSASQFLPTPYYLAQSSYDVPPSFSMEDFEGDISYQKIVWITLMTIFESWKTSILIFFKISVEVK